MRSSNTIFVDNISGVMILHMIFTCHLGHFCLFNNAFPFGFIGIALNLYMAWFFYKSGMFFREKPIKDVFLGGMKHLIVPYVIFGFFGIVVGAIIALNMGESIGLYFRQIPIQLFYDEAPASNGPLWFLISLFAVKIIYMILYKKRVNDIALICIFLTLAIILNWYNYILSPNSNVIFFMGSYIYIPYYVGNICLGVVFYSLGHFLKNRRIYPIVMIISFILYAIHILWPAAIGFHTNTFELNYFLAFTYIVASIIVFNHVFSRHLNKKVPLLTHVGKYSIIPYVCHFPFFLLLFAFFKKYDLDGNKWLCYAAGLVMGSIFLYLCDVIFRKNRLKWIVGL